MRGAGLHLALRIGEVRCSPARPVKTNPPQIARCRRSRNSSSNSTTF